MTIKLDGKRTLVTGASSGIGEAVARALAQSGARVAVHYRSHPESAEALVADIKKSGGDAIAVQGDVSQPGDVTRIFQTLDTQWGGIDILINNAGMDGERAMSWDVDLAAWRQVIEVNLFGAFYCAREALKRMVLQKNGVILSTSSVHEVIAWSGYSAYATSKAALSMLTKTLAQEAAPFGVRVLALAPGAIKTPINRSVWADPKGLADLLEKIPLKRVGEPEEVARMAVMLVSDVASYVTACTVFVDGGMTDFPDFAQGG
jgi:glucose 1-dehydrogenase